MVYLICNYLDLMIIYDIALMILGIVIPRNNDKYLLYKCKIL